MNVPYKQLIAGAALVSSFATVSTVAHAQELTNAEITGNVLIGTDYRFRGITQTDEAFTLQGGLDYVHESGFYMGVWGSNVAFAGSLELDPYVGYSGSLNSEVDYDIGVLYYGYPNDPSDPEGDFWEFYGSLAWQGVSFGVAYSPDYFAETGKYWYVNGAYDMELPGEFGLGFSLASNIFEGREEMDSFLGLTGSGISAGSSYLDWSVTLSKSVYGVDLSLAYVDTDLKKSECFLGDDGCGATAVFAISKSL